MALLTLPSLLPCLPDFSPALPCPSRRRVVLVSECESQCCVTPGGWQSYPEPLHICKEGMQHRVCRLRSLVLGRSTALGVRSQIPALALLPLLLFWLQLSHLSNGHGTRWSLNCCPEPIMEFCMNSKGGEWLQMHPLHADGALSLVGVTSPALFLQCCLPRPSSSEPKERG